jgi:hypothetical protein
MGVVVSGLKNEFMFKKLFKKDVVADQEKQLAEWEKNGRLSPPPHIVKQKTIDDYRKKYGFEILVETGTYLGDMVEAQRDNFKRIYSIELSERLFAKAKKRFKAFPHITILQGDSGIVLNKLAAELDQPAIFWLDGHYSGGITALGAKECPVPEELNAILKSKFDHVILIDDARLFNGTNDYPTIREINAMLETKGKPFAIETRDDIIRITQ